MSYWQYVWKMGPVKVHISLTVLSLKACSQTNKQTNFPLAFSPQANYTDWVTQSMQSRDKLIKIN
jgi:hypothetical protein